MPKNVKLIIISALFAVIFLFSACTRAPQGPTDIITYKDTAINSDMYRFLLAVKKTDSVFSMYNETVDKPEYWETEDGHETADFIKSQATTYAKTLLYYRDIANANGLTVTETEFDASYANYVNQFGGTEESLEKEMRSYGFTLDILREFISLSLIADKGVEFVHSSTGADPLTEADYEKYYYSSYITLRHLYLNDISDESGKYLDSDGRGAVKARADEIEKLIAGGSDLADFADESDDGILSSYPDGITIPLDNDLYLLSDFSAEGDSFNLYAMYYYLIYSNPEFTAALLNSEKGEVVRVKLEDGHFFVQRLETDPGAYEQFLPFIKTSSGIKTMKINDTVKRGEKDFTENKDAIALILMRDIPVVNG